MLNKIAADLKTDLPAELVDFLFAAYREIKENYLLERHEPSELNGGKLVEACFRILEYKTKGSYTPIGTQTNDMIGKLRAFEQLPATSTIESYRIHIPRTLASIYNIRNKRGVGHLSADVSPNFVDSTLINCTSDWVIAELLRIFYSCTLHEAQKLVNALAIRPSFLVHEIDEIKRVLNPSLKQKEQVLVLLASSYPKKVSESDLIKWIEPKSKATFVNSVLKKLHAERLIEYQTDKNCLILPPGLKYVDTHYSSFINQN
ncbi:hypothetical protein [Parafilimonas terrae]|uniref:Uncharacterized protein n=1 Tax=Parafilimonas terrae TaxID=1465490 RepID=A0A1I5ZIP5_9BACT|nr:hypothetical protein [Parafilimonas terrae]SFQ56364.1 hypothetical protein SAMN05444277_1362 [Parafilimonas terrae]